MTDGVLGVVPAEVPAQVVARAFAALGSSWDASPVEIPVAGFAQAMLYITYARGEAGGIVDVQVQFSPYALDAEASDATRVWFDMAEAEVPVGAGGTPYTLLTQTAFWQLDSEEAVDNFYLGPVPFARYGAERLRVRAREAGEVQEDGSCEIVAYLGW